MLTHLSCILICSNKPLSIVALHLIAQQWLPLQIGRLCCRDPLRSLPALPSHQKLSPPCSSVLLTIVSQSLSEDPFCSTPQSPPFLFLYMSTECCQCGHWYVPWPKLTCLSVSDRILCQCAALNTLTKLFSSSQSCWEHSTLWTIVPLTLAWQWPCLAFPLQQQMSLCKIYIDDSRHGMHFQMCTRELIHLFVVPHQHMI